jgi:hypothetical protein
MALNLLQQTSRARFTRRGRSKSEAPESLVNPWGATAEPPWIAHAVGSLLEPLGSREVVGFLAETALPIVDAPRDRPRRELATFLSAWEYLEHLFETVALAEPPEAKAQKLDLPIELGREPGLCAAVALGLCRARIEAGGPRYSSESLRGSDWVAVWGADVARHVAGVEAGKLPPLHETLWFMQDLATNKRGSPARRGRPSSPKSIAAAVLAVMMQHGFTARLDLPRITVEVVKIIGPGAPRPSPRALQKALRGDRIRWLQNGTDERGVSVYWIGAPARYGGAPRAK